MGVKLVGDWTQAKAVLAASPANLARALHQATVAEAAYIEGKLKASLKKAAPPNAPSTILQKKSSRPLIASGDMFGSIAVTPGPSGGLFIGIPRANAAGVRLAELHEKGKVIVQRITPKQRKFLHALLAKLGPGGPPGSGVPILVIHIPARPFIKPVFDAISPTAGDRFLRRLLKALNGKFGTV